MSSRKLLIVTPHWVPVNAPDLHRARTSLRGWREAGWEPIILAVDPNEVAATCDPELAATLPPRICTYWSKAVPLRWTRRVGLRTLGWRSLVPLWWLGRQIIRRETPALVYMTNTQFLSFAAARLWRAEFGIPYVLDLQDPWRDPPTTQGSPPRRLRSWKQVLATVVGALLEPWTFRRSAGFVSVSPEYLRCLAQRYSWSRNVPSAVIPFGFDMNDLSFAQAGGSAHTFLSAQRSGEISLVYTGAAGPIDPRALSIFLAALARIRTLQPALYARLRVCFIGTQYVEPGRGTPLIQPEAARFGVAECIHEVPHRVGYLEALRCAERADSLLIFGSIEDAYSPSKLSSSFALRKPILALVRPNTVLAQRLAELGGACCIAYLDGDSIEQTIRFLERAREGFPPGVVPERQESHFAAHFDAEVLAHRQAELFDRALSFERNRSHVCV